MYSNFMNSVIDHFYDLVKVCLIMFVLLPFNFCFRLGNFGVFEACRPTGYTKTQTRPMNTLGKTIEKDPKILKKDNIGKLIF